MCACNTIILNNYHSHIPWYKDKALQVKRQGKVYLYTYTMVIQSALKGSKIITTINRELKSVLNDIEIDLK